MLIWKWPLKPKSSNQQSYLHKMCWYTVMLKKVALPPKKKNKTDWLNTSTFCSSLDETSLQAQSVLNLNFDVVWHSILWKPSWLICNGITANSSEKEKSRRWLCQRSEETYKYQRTEARAREQDTALHPDVSLVIANPIVSLRNVLKEIKDFTAVFRVWR